MSKLYSGFISTEKIDKERIQVGKNGKKYINIMVWVNDEPDEFGNHLSIQQKVKKGEKRIYIGNGKEFDINETPQPSGGPTDDLPF